MQRVACHLYGAKALPQPIMTYYHLDANFSKIYVESVLKKLFWSKGTKFQ